MTNFFLTIKAEFFKFHVTRAWYVSLSIITFVIGLFVARNFLKDISTGLQLGSLAYNPAIMLIEMSLNILSGIILPFVLSIVIFLNLKQTDSPRTWIYGLNTQKSNYYTIGKLAAVVFVWFLFLSVLYALHLLLTLITVCIYPNYFLGYENNYQFVTFWFVKYYVCSLGAISLIYLINVLIKSKAAVLLTTLLLPYLGIFFSQKGILFPLSYPYFSTFRHLINFKAHTRLHSGKDIHYSFEKIFTGYEILSLIIVSLSILFILLNHKMIINKLVKP